MTLYLKDKINLNELNERNEGRTLKVEVSVENIVFLHTYFFERYKPQPQAM